MSTPKVAVIGLDCGTPQLLFEDLADRMPVLTGLRSESLWGPLRSTAPPITVPAWSCMFSGRTPGELGIYGFRNRADHSYDGLVTATSEDVPVSRTWDLLSARGRQSVLLGVPGTYPAPRIRGTVVTDFLTPSTATDWARPAGVAEEIREVAGDYVFDVFDFRTHDKARVARQLCDMTEQRFDVARHLAAGKEWDLFAMVDMGPDRLHHGFWATQDATHPRFAESSAHRGLFGDYYEMLDDRLGHLLEVLGDDTTVLVVSDHGARPMLGGFCINEWLVARGLLVLSGPVTGRTPIAEAPIDWSRTVAWADGGYYARVFLNVAGREPRGTVAPADYESVRDRLAADLEEVLDHRGEPMGNRALRPEELYPEVRGVAPDLIVYLGDLSWRSVDTLGLGDGLHTFENDTGPDDANHAQEGVLLLSGPGLPRGRAEGLSIYDVAPTLQDLLGLGAPAGQLGRSLVG